MPSLDWAKIKAATLMIGASAKSFDWAHCLARGDRMRGRRHYRQADHVPA